MKRIEDLMHLNDTIVIKRSLISEKSGIRFYQEQLNYYRSDSPKQSNNKPTYTFYENTIKDCLTHLFYELNKQDVFCYQQSNDSKIDDMIKSEDSALFFRKINRDSKYISFLGYLENEKIYPLDEAHVKGTSIEESLNSLNQYYEDIDHLYLKKKL